MMSKPTNAPLLVDRRELSRLLSVSVATIDRLASAGKIGPVAIRVSNGRIAWRYHSVERWIAASEAHGELLDRKTWQAMQDGPHECRSGKGGKNAN